MFNVSDELYARPSKLKIFVSSQMRGGVLDVERRTATAAIESTRFATSWCWERHAKAGPYSSESICLGHARTSDGLILLLSAELTPITYKEYEAAQNAGAPCYIFLKDGVTRDDRAAQFVERERAHAVTANFRNSSELRTQITGALREYSNRAVREKILRTRVQRSPLRQGIHRLQAVLVTRLGRAGRTG